MRACKTCQHLKRPEIDRRLAAGELLTRVAHDYGLTTSSLYRHRANCLKLASSNAIIKDAACGSAAMALLPSKETLGSAYLELRDRIDQIVAQAEQQGSLARRAYAQLEALEPEMRESGIVYKCLPGQHDDLGISCAMLNWAARHPHLEWWMGNMVAARRPRRRPQPKISWAAWS